MAEILTKILVSPYARAAFVFVGFFVAAKITYLFLTHVVTRLTRKTTTQLDDIILSRVKGPIYYLIVLAGLSAALEVLPLVPTIKVTLSRVLISIVIAISCYLAGSIINLTLKSWLDQRKSILGKAKEQELIIISRKILNFIVFILLFIFILKLWQIEVTPLIASLGIAGFILGFALRDIFANIFGGIALIADKSFKIGDFIKLDTGEMGEVIDIGLRSTRIKSFEEGNEIIVPNSTLVMSKITNYGRPMVNLKMVINIGVAYGSEVGKVKGVLLHCVTKLKEVLKDPPPRVYFMEMADFSLNFRIVFWIRDYRDRFDIQDKVISSAYQELQAQGIKIPFPTRTIYLEK